jgi:hypothetical protein
MYDRWWRALSDWSPVTCDKRLQNVNHGGAGDGREHGQGGSVAVVITFVVHFKNGGLRDKGLMSQNRALRLGNIAGSDKVSTTFLLKGGIFSRINNLAMVHSL